MEFVPLRQLTKMHVHAKGILAMDLFKSSDVALELTSSLAIEALRPEAPPT